MKPGSTHFVERHAHPITEHRGTILIPPGHESLWIVTESSYGQYWARPLRWWERLAWRFGFKINA